MCNSNSETDNKIEFVQLNWPSCLGQDQTQTKEHNYCSVRQLLLLVKPIMKISFDTPKLCLCLCIGAVAAVVCSFFGTFSNLFTIIALGTSSLR